MRGWPLLLVLLGAGSVQAATVEVPELAFTGTTAATIASPTPIHAARFYVDGQLVGQQLNVSASSLAIMGSVLDGRHEWLVEVEVEASDGEVVLQSFTGSLVSQNLAPLISHVVQAALAEVLQQGMDAAELAEAAGVAARAAVNESRNATLAAQAIHVPDDLARQDDLAALATTASILESGGDVKAAVRAENGRVLMQQAGLETQIGDLAASIRILVVLCCIAAALSLLAVVRLRRASSFDDQDRLLLRAVALHVGLKPESPAITQAQTTLGQPRRTRLGRPRAPREVPDQAEGEPTPRRRRAAG